jgi:hypothetical protein
VGWGFGSGDAKFGTVGDWGRKKGEEESEKVRREEGGKGRNSKKTGRKCKYGRNEYFGIRKSNHLFLFIYLFIPPQSIRKL